MSDQNKRPVKKTPVSGAIQQRWPKPRVVRWLEIGAVPAILGLWLPDWVGAYARAAGGAPGLVPPFPPILTYVGGVVLLVACYQGIKHMGTHFLGVVTSGGLFLLAAAASIVLQLLGLAAASLLATGLAGVSAASFFWFTIGKVAEITQERRTRLAWYGIAASTVVTAAVYLYGVYVFAFGAAAQSIPLLRTGVALLTLTFILSRYGVHCYKTQTSIGAGFAAAPDEQYWARAS